MSTTPNVAAKGLIQALKDPALNQAQRAALLAALEALHTDPHAGHQPTPSPKSKPAKTERKANAVRFTKAVVDALELPTEGEAYVYDTISPALAVRLRPSGRSYVFVKWDKERRRAVKVTLGKTILITPEQARRKADELTGRAADGEDLRRPAQDGLTLARLIDQWQAEKQSLRTVDEMADKARDYAGKLLHRPAAEVEREHIGTIHHHIATQARRRVRRRIEGELRTVEVGEAGVPHTADKWLAIMSSIYGWALKKGLLSDNPCKGIGKTISAKDSARQTYLHGDGLVKFWKALHADHDADVRDLLLLALYTGQRRGNVLAMRWADVDLGAGLWTIPASETKQKKPQSVALPSQARLILQRRYKDASSPWVFPAVRRSADGTLGHMSDTRPRDAWERICTEARLEGVRIHDLRHTAGSWLARLGANEAIRQKALGHQTPQMAARYTHLELDPVADAVQDMASAIEAAASKKPAAPVVPMVARRAKKSV